MSDLSNIGLVPPVITDKLRGPGLFGVPVWAWGAGLAGGIGVAIWQRKAIADAATATTQYAEKAAGAVTEAAEVISSAAKAAAFKAALSATAPPAVPYAELILRIAEEEAISPVILTAFGMRESNWGQSLASDGTGDHTARVGDWLKAKGVKVVQSLPAGWYAPKSGNTTLGGPYAIPSDGRGWGRGIMQVDWQHFASGAYTHNWQDPYENVKRGVAIYKKTLREITAPPSGNWTIGSDLAKKLGVNPGTYPARAVPANLAPLAAIAAYNAGAAAIRRAYSAAGQVGIDRATTGGDYGTWVMNVITRIEGAIQTAVA